MLPAARDLILKVSDLLREAAEIHVMPVFGKRDLNPLEKAPGEWVTEADRSCEIFLERSLRSLMPGSLVIGEEAASADSQVLSRLDRNESIWLIDPLDGTSNFASGKSPFAIMVALLDCGVTVASWILDPVTGKIAVAQKGSGAWIDGEPITVSQASPPLEKMNGAVLRRFLPPEISERVTAAEHFFAELSPGSKCAGFDYPAIATGAMDFALYWRTLPWDHIAGVLFLQEAGGYAARLDGSEYLASEHARSGLLVAHNEGTWSQVQSRMFG